MQQLLQQQTQANTELEAELKVQRENNQVIFIYFLKVYFHLMSSACLTAVICLTLSEIILNFRNKIWPP